MPTPEQEAKKVYETQIKDPRQGGYTIGGIPVDVSGQFRNLAVPPKSTDVGTDAVAPTETPQVPQTSGLSKVATQGVGQDGKPIYDVFSGQEHIQDPNDPRLRGTNIPDLPSGTAPGGFKSKFQKGFDKATADGKGAESTGTEALTTVGEYAPVEPKTSPVIANFFQQDPFMGQLLKSYQDFTNPINQRKSLTETYQTYLKDSGIQAIDMELINTKKVIEGTEDDLRTEITKAGGFATESQVLALTNSRNKQLIKNYNTLLETRNSKEKYLTTMIGLEALDRESADKKFEQSFNMAFQIADYGQKMQTNAIASLDRVKGAIGWDGLLTATQNDPYTQKLIEKTYGLPQGGLELAAQEAIRIKTQAKAKEALELDLKRAELEAKPLERELKAEQIKTERAQRAKILKELEKPSGIETITPYQHEQAVRVVNSVSNLKDKVSDSVVGTLRAKVSRFIPGTGAANFKAEVEQLKTQIFTRELAAMRDASKTGGAVGNVSDTEGEKLGNTLGALDLNQSPEQFKKNLIEVENSLNRWYSALAGENVILAPDGTLKKITD